MSANSIEAELLVTVNNGLRIIRFNRPEKKNALNAKLFQGFAPALEEATADPNTTIVAITGTGDYFTSGNDLANFNKTNQDADSSEEGGGSNDMNGLMLAARDGFNRFVKSLIDFPKPLVAVVNGPAVGVGVTMLALCDIVYASERATFYTPFVQLGQSPEACSSYLFPKLMGQGKAAEILYFGKKITANEAFERGLVTEVFPHANLGAVWLRLANWAKLPTGSVRVAKQLTRFIEKDILHKVNNEECDQLMKRFQSDEFLEALLKFYSRKSKL